MNDKKIFIGNLPFKVDEDSFKELYNSINIISVELLKIKDGRPSGFGIVTIGSEILEALIAINSTEIDGRLISATEYITY